MCSETPISSWDVASSAKDLAVQKHVGLDGAAECTRQQEAFRMPTSILAPAAYIPIIPGLETNLGSGLNMPSATSENWAKIYNCCPYIPLSLNEQGFIVTKKGKDPNTYFT